MAENFRGEWLAPGDPGYDEHRAHFNPRYDRHPELIARCMGVQDVRIALRVARERGSEVAVRGGGRGFGGHSTIEGGLLIDLSLMNDVYVAGFLHPGVTPNYSTQVEAREAWGEQYEGLAALKAKYDPDNVFCHNVNIAPA